MAKKTKIKPKIKTDPKGYWNPKNQGKPVKIPSNQITMKGVNQNLLGISDTGDIQLMYPNQDYLFDGSSVTEYPIMQVGGRTPIKGTKEQYQAYQDSLDLYNESQHQFNITRGRNIMPFSVTNFPSTSSSQIGSRLNQAVRPGYNSLLATIGAQPQITSREIFDWERRGNNQADYDSTPQPINRDDVEMLNRNVVLNNPRISIRNRQSPEFYHPTISPDRVYNESHLSQALNFLYPQPVQPIVYQPEVSIDHSDPRITSYRENFEDDVEKLNPLDIRPKDKPINLQSAKPTLLQSNNEPLQLETIPFQKGTYFSRPRQSGDPGSTSFPDRNKALTDYYDKKTGKLIGTYEFGGNIVLEKYNDLDMAKNGKKIKIKPSKVGSLRKHLGVPEGEKIPASKLKIKSTDSEAIRKKKQFAINARKWSHKEDGGYIPMYQDGGNPLFNPGYYDFDNPNQNMDYNAFMSSPDNTTYSEDLRMRAKLFPNVKKGNITTPEITGMPNYKQTIETPKINSYDFYNPQTGEVNKPKSKDKLDFTFKGLNIYPLSGNRYMQQGINDFNRASIYASNIGKKPTDYNIPYFQTGGQTIQTNPSNDLHFDYSNWQGFSNPQSAVFDNTFAPQNDPTTQAQMNESSNKPQNTSNTANTIGTIANIAGTVGNSVLGTYRFAKGTLDMIGDQKQNSVVQKMQSDLQKQSVYSQAMDTIPQDYIFNRNALAEHGMQIREIGGKGIPTTEIEGGEHVLLNNGMSQEVQGAKHSDGGIKLNLEPGTKIFSEKLKVETPKGKKSYAQLAKPFETKKNVDALEAKGADAIQKNTANMVIKFKQNKLEELFAKQEMDKMTGLHGKQIMKESINENMMKYGGLTKAQTGKSLRGTGKDVENLFNNLDEVYENYKSKGYTGAKDITQMREWSYKKDPQGVNAYILRSRPTNAHKKLWEQKYSKTEPIDLQKMDREDVFKGYNDKLWDYRAFKFGDDPVQTPSTQPITTPDPVEKIVFKDRYTKPNIELGNINLGIPLPNIYGREPLNYYQVEPEYIDPRYLDIQPQLNRITRGNRAFQTNLGSRGTTDISNLLQSQINAYNAEQEAFGTKYNYDRAQDATAQQFNAQAKMNTNQYNQQSWFNQLEDRIQRREGAIDTQKRLDATKSIENMNKMRAFSNNKALADTFYPLKNMDLQTALAIYGNNPEWFNQYTTTPNTKEEKKYGGKVKIKPRLKKK